LTAIFAFYSKNGNFPTEYSMGDLFGQERAFTLVFVAIAMAKGNPNGRAMRKSLANG
jgi:hypothetical protein